MVIEKENFVNICEAVETVIKKLEKIYDAFDSGGSLWECDELSKIWRVYDALSKDIGDEADKYGTLLDAFIYDHEFGTDYKKIDYLVEFNDKKYAPKTYGEFYDMMLDWHDWKFNTIADDIKEDPEAED